MTPFRLFTWNLYFVLQTAGRRAPRSESWGAPTPSSKTGPGRSACSKGVATCAEARWCRRAGLSRLHTASPGGCRSARTFQRGSGLVWSAPLAHRSVFVSSSGPRSSKKELTRWRVMSGRTYMSTLGGSQVDRIIRNGEYDPEKNDYDIALMRLSSPITVGGKSLSPRPLKQRGRLVLLPFGNCFKKTSRIQSNKYICCPRASVSQRPVCLSPKGFDLPAGSTMAVSGWGYLEENGERASTPPLSQRSLLELKRDISVLRLCFSFVAEGLGPFGGPGPMFQPHDVRQLYHATDDLRWFPPGGGGCLPGTEAPRYDPAIKPHPKSTRSCFCRGTAGVLWCTLNLLGGIWWVW